MSRHSQTFVPRPPRRTKAIRRASRGNAPPSTPSFPPNDWPETEVINFADREPAFPLGHNIILSTLTEATSSKKRRRQQATSRRVAVLC